MANRDTQLTRRNGDLMQLDPWSEMQDMRRTMDDMFSRFFGYSPSRLIGNAFPSALTSWQPNVDLCENENEYLFSADLPGFKQEDIDIRLTADTLTINAQHSEEATQTPQARQEGEPGNGAQAQGSEKESRGKKSEKKEGDQESSQAVQRAESQLPRTYHIQNRQRQSFSATYTLPGEINPDKTEATYQNGVLEICMPKSERARPKQVQVKVNG